MQAEYRAVRAARKLKDKKRAFQQFRSLAKNKFDALKFVLHAIAEEITEITAWEEESSDETDADDEVGSDNSGHDLDDRAHRNRAAPVHKPDGPGDRTDSSSVAPAWPVFN